MKKVKVFQTWVESEEDKTGWELNMPWHTEDHNIVDVPNIVVTYEDKFGHPIEGYHLELEEKYDKHVGTPCEEIRHKEAVDVLPAQIPVWIPLKDKIPEIGSWIVWYSYRDNDSGIGRVIELKEGETSAYSHWIQISDPTAL